MYLGRIVEIGPAEDVLLRPDAPLHEGSARRRARGRGARAADPDGRAAGSDPHPRGLPVPPAMPGRRHPAEPPSWASSRECRGEDLALRELAPDHEAACYEASVRHEGGAASSRLIASDGYVGGPGASRPPDVLGSAVVALEHPEDRLHLGVGDPRIARSPRRASRAPWRAPGPQVRLGHLGPGFELADLRPRVTRARLSALVAGLARLPRLLARGPQGGAHLRDLASQLDQAIDHARDRSRSTRAARRRRTRRRRGARLHGFPRAPPERLLLARLDRSRVEQPVGPLRRLEAPASDQRPHRPRRRQRVGEPELMADLGRRHRHHLADRRVAARGRGKEGVRPDRGSVRSSGQSCPTRPLPQGGPSGHADSSATTRRSRPTPGRLRPHELDRAIPRRRARRRSPACGSIDLSRVLAGPLAHDDARRPGGRRDQGRASRRGRRHAPLGAPFAGDDAAYFLSLNRNKRSVDADLRTPEGVDAVRAPERPCRRADRELPAGTDGRARAGARRPAAAHPRLVTCSLTAFGDGRDARPPRAPATTSSCRRSAG